VITPPQLHIAVDASVNAGFPPTVVVGWPGVHGAAVAGMQGIGVRTPSAAEVAAATCGLESDMHTPNGGMFIIGLLSMIVAIGMFAAVTVPGVASRLEGAAPNEHFIMQPVLTAFGIVVPSTRVGGVPCPSREEDTPRH